MQRIPWIDYQKENEEHFRQTLTVEIIQQVLSAVEAVVVEIAFD